ncbi:MAG: arsenate reductase ArsC [Chloroflexi bacterium]|nr:arsenate reductase ArsC [Chloroflexota bacterium]
MRKRRVLFLCTGNSARSQMAEGLVRHFLGDQWEAHSAGTRPAGYVHPLAVQTMAELGIDITHQRSKPVEAFRDVPFDLIVTVCDDAARNCPAWPGQGQTIHIRFPDPAEATGSPEEQLTVFRQIRDDIRERVLGHLRRYPLEPGG